MSALMELPVPPQLQKKGEDPSSELGSDQAINPWPSLVGWIFLVSPAASHFLSVYFVFSPGLSHSLS